MNEVVTGLLFVFSEIAVVLSVVLPRGVLAVPLLFDPVTQFIP